MRPKLLIVEDDPIQSDGLARLLGSRGYFVDVVDNGRDAVRRICTGRFDIALIDYRIPEIDGIGVALAIHNLEGLSRRPRLIALTVSPQELLANAGEFDAILGKPIALDALLEAIEHGRNRDENPGDAESYQAKHIIPDERLQDQDRDPFNGRAGSRGRILLADDDPHLREFLKLTLEASHLDVDLAEDGLQAVRLIETRSYDVVVVDFRMPKLDGLAAAKIIYDLGNRQVRPRIIALTSTPDGIVARDPKWSLVLDAIVAKASGPQAILSAVQECIDYKARQLKLPVETVDIWNLAEMESSLAQLTYSNL